MAKSGVYIITCLINNRHYIGYSSSVRVRLNVHKSDLRFNRHDNEHLQNAYNKYGKKNFTFEPLEYYPVDQMASFENWWCNMLDTHNREFGFNIKPTGDQNHTVSIETRAKQSKVRIGELNHFYGKQHSIETKLKISVTRKLQGGKKHTEESIAKMRIAQKGKVVSDEAKNKLRIAHTGKILTSEHKQNLSKARIGNTNSSTKIITLNVQAGVFEIYPSVKKAANEFGCCGSNISRVYLNKNKEFKNHLFFTFN